MKEININIEGYNVNGICVGCLNYNRRMFYDADIKKCFKLLADIDVSDGLDIQLCWECLAYIKKCMTFRRQILKSYDFLINYSQQNTFLDSPNVFESRATKRLAKSDTLLSVYYVTISEDSVPLEVKTENVEDALKHESTIKEETVDSMEDVLEDTMEDTLEDKLEDTLEDLPSPASDVTSDDNIQLSMLQEKKKVKRKKRKILDLPDNEMLEEEHEEKTDTIKKRRRKRIKEENEDTGDQDNKLYEVQTKIKQKLKNLPDVVELYTMTEEEMWAVREDDRQSAEFTKVKFRCSDCVIVFANQRLKIDHMNGKHKRKPHYCNICKAYFRTQENLSHHRALHMKAYKCIVCSLKTTLKMRMIKHVSVHKNAQTFICETCGLGFSTVSRLKYHRKVCMQERPQCDCCGKVFANKVTLRCHLRPVNKTDKPKEKLFIPCKGCDKVFTSKKSYRSHVVIHDGISYPCPICGKLFQWKRNLARHTRNHREREAGASYECKLCRKSFSSRDCYKNHLSFSKKHVPEAAYQHECTYCGKKFATKWCLTDHVDWDHLKRIKYQCRICFKAFKTSKIMVAHVNNIHEAKKKEVEGEHLCEVCGKSYKTEKRLKGHVWAMHTKRSNTKSFKCKLCPAAYTWQTSIYKHMKMMHDTDKKTKPTRTVPTVKKEDPYSGIELRNAVQYVQQDITSNLNLVQLQPLSVNQNRIFYSMNHK